MPTVVSVLKDIFSIIGVHTAWTAILIIFLSTQRKSLVSAGCVLDFQEAVLIDKDVELNRHTTNQRNKGSNSVCPILFKTIDNRVQQEQGSSKTLWGTGQCCPCAHYIYLCTLPPLSFYWTWFLIVKTTYSAFKSDTFQVWCSVHPLQGLLLTLNCKSKRRTRAWVQLHNRPNA